MSLKPMPGLVDSGKRRWNPEARRWERWMMALSLWAPAYDVADDVPRSTWTFSQTWCEPFYGMYDGTDVDPKIILAFSYARQDVQDARRMVDEARRIAEQCSERCDRMEAQLRALTEPVDAWEIDS